MDRDELRPHLVELLGTLVWDDLPADQRRRLEESLSAQAAAAGLDWPTLWRGLSDEGLALAVQKGVRWQEAFEELFVHRHLPYLLRWFYRWRVGPDRARDLTQELFCRFTQNRLASFTPDRNFRAYLHRAARNLWLDACVRPHHLAALHPGAEPPSAGPGPEEELLGHDLALRFERALEQLPLVERTVLRETADGRGAADIARDLGVSRERVFSWLFQARRKMEKLLALPSQTRAYGRGRARGT
jgi:RNA polymerase sigma factor (sigma-70 family)